jgi:hypothetical protein
MTLMALLARVTRSTNRSTPHHGEHRMLSQNVTTARPTSATTLSGIRPPDGSRTLLTAEPLDLGYKHEIIRRVHQERDQAPALRPEMQ